VGEVLLFLLFAGVAVVIWHRIFWPKKDTQPLPHISSEVVRVHDQARITEEPEDIGVIHEPRVPPAAPPVVYKHQIIGHSYHKAYNGSLWPTWVCKCGGSAYSPTGIYTSLEKAQREARMEGEAHVRNGNQAEEMLAKTNGAYAW
jgi:hypothetical protein